MILAALAFAALAASPEIPFYQIRLRACETDDPAVWAETRKALADHPGCCDEVWFSTGISYPPLAAHRERAARQASAAADCRRLGIAPGLQIQATLGHSDAIGAGGGDMSAMAWQGWTGSQGVVDRFCSCPRDPRFIAYFEAVAALYAAYRPSSVWIDDDLRIDNHNPASKGSLEGCWCDRCRADFARAEGRVAETREALAAAVARDAALRRAWARFQYGSLAAFARRVALAVRKVSPESRLAYQHALRADGLQTLVFDALAEASGRSVASRPGGGAYFDHDPHDQLVKAYLMMRQRDSLRGAKAIGMFCPEIETCPRTRACRTPRGVLLEAFENLALGMDALSFLITDSRFEKMSWYGQTFFKALAENRAFLQGFAARCVGTRPAGLLVEPSSAAFGAGVRWPEVCSGVPLVLSSGRALGRYADLVKLNGGPLDVTAASSGEIVRRSRLADQAAGGRLPAVLVDPFVGFVMPRVTEAGELRALALVNTTIGRSESTRLRLRGVPADLRELKWRALDSGAVRVAFVRDGADVIATLPPLEGWSAGWLDVVRAGDAVVYSVPPCEETRAAGYRVTVGGVEAPVSAVRNSAMPVNIRWPGHQRDLDQTEIGGIVRFAFSGRVRVVVTAPRDFREVKVRPLAKGVRPVVSGRRVAFDLTAPGGYSVEFDGIHTNLQVFADPSAAYAVDPAAPNTLYFGPGEHHPGLIELTSGQTLYIDEGAVVFGRVHARDADHIRILGRGILDGSRVKAVPLAIDPALEAEQRRRKFAVTNVRRFDEIRLDYCDDVIIDGLTVRDSPLYNIRPICCRGLTIRNVKLCGNWRYNSDGIDMHNCENVRISDCFVRTFDDAICFKGFDYRMDEREMLHDGYCHDVFTNAVVERCTVWCDWGKALEFGAETRAREIANVTFRDCDVIRVCGSACDILNCDSADVHDVRFESIRIEHDSPVYRAAYSASAKDFNPAPVKDGSPAFFGAFITVIPEYSKGDARRGRNRDILLRDIRVTGPTAPYCVVNGYDAAHRTTGVTLRNIFWNGVDVTDAVRRSARVGAFADPLK